LLGALLAVPLTASVKVLFVRYIWEKRLEPAVEKRLGSESNEESGNDEREEPSPA
jgi:predicted PurR-regulated permease PerM